VNRTKEGQSEHPIRLAGSVLGHHRHVCAFFNSRDEECCVLLPFIKEGFEGGENASHIVDPKRRDEHLERLRSAGIGGMIGASAIAVVLIPVTFYVIERLFAGRKPPAQAEQQRRAAESPALV
jgi:hypothetical protein